MVNFGGIDRHQAWSQEPELRVRQATSVHSWDAHAQLTAAIVSGVTWCRVRTWDSSVAGSCAQSLLRTL